MCLSSSHSFGYDSGRRANLQLLDAKTLIFIAGNVLVLLDVDTKKQRYLRSCSGGGIGAIAVITACIPGLLNMYIVHIINYKDKSKV